MGNQGFPQRERRSRRIAPSLALEAGTRRTSPPRGKPGEAPPHWGSFRLDARTLSRAGLLILPPMGGSPGRFTSPIRGMRGPPTSAMVRFDLGGRSPSHSPENGSFPEPFSFVGEPLASRRSAVQFWRLSIRRWIAMLPNQGLEEAVGDTPTARVPPTVARERVGEERLAT